MKRTAFILVFFLLGAVLFGVDISYKIENYSSDMEVLKEKITVAAEEGFTPLGLSHDGAGRTYVLYVSGIIEFDSWQLVEYEELFAFREGMTERIESGMYPVGFSYLEGKYYVLFIRSKNSVTSWQMVPTEFSEQTAKADLKPYFSNGFMPAGIGGIDEQMLVLVLEMEEQLGKQWNLIRYPAEGDFITQQIGENLRSGRVPWGIHFKDDKLYISYIQL